MLIGNPMIYRQLPFEQALSKSFEAGYEALELWPPQIAEFRTPELRHQLRNYVASRGCRLVRLNCADREYFQGLTNESDLEPALAGLKADIDFAVDLGMNQVLTWEGRRPRAFSAAHGPDEILTWTASLFTQACSYASDKGVELTVEVHPFTLGIDCEWLVRLCDRLESFQFSVTYDCCHFGVGLPRGYVEAITRLGSRIGHVHFSDSDQKSSEVHFAPGTGTLDLEAIVDALQKVHFRGSMMLDLWLYPLPDEGTRIGIPYVRNVIERLGIG